MTATTEQNYYRLRFSNDVSEVFAFGDNIEQAIANARHDMSDIELGSVYARPAVYGEWKHETWRYRNDGGFIRGENWASTDIVKSSN